MFPLDIASSVNQDLYNTKPYIRSILLSPDNVSNTV